MKKILSVLIFGTIITTNAQDKVVELPVRENCRVVQNQFTENGTTFIVTSNDKSPKADLNITRYDSILNLVYSKDFVSEYKRRPSMYSTTPQYFYRLGITPKGKHVTGVMDNIIIGDKGNIKPFPYYYPNEINEFEASFDILTDNYRCYFGYMKADKKKTQTNMCKVNMETAAREFTPLNFPNFESKLTEEKESKSSKDESKKIWGIASYDDQKFLMINKELSKDWTQNQYNIVAFDYDGKLVPNSSISLVVQLKDKSLTLSDTGFGSSKIVTGEMVGGAYMDDTATGNVYIEGKNEFYYIYGLYATKKNSNMNAAKYNGFYIYKFNAKGEIVWKTEQEITNSKFNEKQRPLAIKVDLRMLKNNQFGFRIYSFYEKYAHLFLINAKDGKITRNQNTEFKIEDYRWAGINNGSFPTGYALEKEYPKKHMDINAIYAGFLNPKVNTFLSKPSNVDLNYNCEINGNGIYLIEEDVDAKKFKLMKFDW